MPLAPEEGSWIPEKGYRAMRWGGLSLLAVFGGLLAWRAIRRPESLPRPLSEIASDLRCRVQTGAIRWSAAFLSSAGAVQSAAQAEQEALLAHKVACALADSLGAGSRAISVVVRGKVIHLEGRVGSAEEREEAERVAREASGARVLADDLEIG